MTKPGKGPGGRPSLYDPSYCDEIIDFMSDGFSIAGFAGHIKVARSTVYEWAEQYPEFSDALNQARAASALWWEQNALKNATEGEAAGSALVNAYVESGAFPGLEGAVDEFPMTEVGAGEAGLAADGLHIADASPRTLYVRRDVLNAEEIIRWAKSQGFKKTLAPEDLHVTVAFSKAPLDWMRAGDSWQERVEIKAGGPHLMEQFGEARVLTFACSDLQWRHEQFKEVGASWDHPEYQPHITISYDPDAPGLDRLTPYDGPIILGHEIFQEVDEGWAEKLTEE